MSDPEPGRSAGVAAALFRMALGAFPATLRRRAGAEMLEAFRRAAEARFARGRWAGWRFTARAVVDVGREGSRERIRRGRVLGGHGARTVETGRGGMFDSMGMDLRLALRGLRRAPGFTVAAVVVLALGIGANATVFSALRVAVLAPPPFPEADRLVLADLTIQRSGDADPEPLIWSFPKFRAFQAMESRFIDPAVGYANRSATLTESGPAERITLELVSPGYFDLVGHAPVVGRAFTPEEADPSREVRVAVLAHETWTGRFGGRAQVLGTELTLNGERFRVVGVAPPGFDGITGGAALWVPMASAARLFSPFMIDAQGAHWFHVLGRLAPGATLEEARAQMVAIGDALSETYPPPNTSRVYSGSARALAEARSNEGARSSVLFLTLAAVLVLLVACANLSGLLLARARRKARDGAVRLAVGASRWRLVRASMVESLTLAGLGGAAGLGVAVLGTRALSRVWPARFLGGEGGGLRVTDPTAFVVDPGVLLFALGITGATGLLFGIGPAIRLAGPDVAARIRDGAGGTRARHRVLGMDVRAALVGGQVALALVLLIGVGLVAESTLRLLDVDEGFRTEGLVTFSYSIPATSSRASDPIGFHDAFLTGLRRLEGVESATFGCAPLRGHCIITRVDAVQGAPEIPAGEGIEIGARMVDDAHFTALGIPLRAGRGFDDRDGSDALPTVVINERAAEMLFGIERAVGRFIELGIGSDGKEPMAEVIGVVGDVLYRRPDRGVMPEAYYSYREFPENHGNVTVRAAGDPLTVVPAIRGLLATLEPTLAMYGVETIDGLIRTSIGDRRTTLGLLTVFAVITLLLAITGTWSIVAYTVADRRRELGLRLALGAREGRVVRTVLQEGVRTAVVGVGGGLVLGLFTSRLLETLLWETEPTEPLVYAGGAGLLFVLVLVASWLPARRAARVDPVQALRAE